MATIDTTKIEGFDSMTAEQKVQALLGISIPDEVDMSKFVSKASFDKTASDLAEAKRQLKGKMSEDEQAKAAQAEREAADKAALEELQAKLDAANKTIMISTYKSSYMALGYDEKLAQETAEALASGDTAKVFANQGKHKAAMEAKIKADLMMKDPRPGFGGGESGEKDPGVELAKALAKSNGGDEAGRQTVIGKYAFTKKA